MSQEFGLVMLFAIIQHFIVILISKVENSDIDGHFDHVYGDLPVKLFLYLVWPLVRPSRIESHLVAALSSMSKTIAIV